MKLKDGFIKRRIVNKTIIVPIGDTARTLHGMIELNETAEFIWDRLMEGTDSENIAEMMCEEFNVPKEKALDDTEKIIEKLQKAGLIEE